jgi:inner membrane protein
MASFIAHGMVAFTIGKVAPGHPTSPGILVTGILCAMLPDLDVITFYMGVPYSHPLGHRGLSHSIIFAMGLAAFIVLLRGSLQGRKVQLRNFLFLFFATVSHGVLDAMTNGGRGVGFFIPFENSRHFFAFRPIQVSPLYVQDFWGEWGMKVIQSELVWIAFPCFIILFIVKIYKSLR